MRHPGAALQICAEEGIQRIGGPHCYSFFTGNEEFLANTDNEFTAFYLTDLLARQFEAFVIEPLKLEKHPELKEMVFGNYTKIVYLAQTKDAELQKKAKWAADYLGLDYEYRFTGYGDLTPAILGAGRATDQKAPDSPALSVLRDNGGLMKIRTLALAALFILPAGAGPCRRRRPQADDISRQDTPREV